MRMRMADLSILLQQLLASIFIFLLTHPSVSDAVHCYDCQHCEKIMSTDDWKSVDCGNATCAKRVVSGYAAVKSRLRALDVGRNNALSKVTK